MNKILILLTAALSLITSAFAGPPTYSLTALPNAQGITIGPFILGINDQGTVFGIGEKPGTDINISYMYSHGKYTFIEPSDSADIQAFNNFNVIIGNLYTGQKTVGFVYNQGKVVTIQPVPSALQTILYGINDLGQIVGFFTPAGLPLGHDHVFIRQVNGTFTDLGDFGSGTGGNYNIPYVLINNQGTVVITQTTNTDAIGGYLQTTYVRQPGSSKLQKIPPLAPGAAGVDVQCINNFGLIAGSAFTDATSYIEHAFLYTNGKTYDAGVLPPTGINPGKRFSWFNCVNMWGVAVGLAGQEYANWTDPSNPQKVISNAGYWHGMVYYNGVMYDLNSLLSAKDKGWVISEGIYINDQGQIVATANYNGGDVASVILTPNGILP